MKNNFQKVQIGVSIIIFIFLCVAFAFLYKKINDNNQKAEQNMTTWQQEAGRRIDMESLDSSVQKMQASKTLLESHFAQSSDVVPFLNTLEGLGTEVGAKAQIDSVDTGADNNNLTVSVEASGSFDSVYKFLTLLENSPYELFFLSMDLHDSGATLPTKGIKTPTWNAVFKIQLLTFTP